MSDGDNATPGHQRASHSGRHSGRGNERLTRKPRPPLGAAPWERADGDTAGTTGDSFGAGSHSDDGGTEGRVSVADLIAKMGVGQPATTPRHRRADPEPAPADSRPEQPASDDDCFTDTIPTPSAYAEELPDLGAIARRRAAAERTGLYQTTALSAPGRIAPQQIGRDIPQVAPAGKSTTKRRSGNRPILLAGRSVAAIIAVLALALTGGAWQWTSSKNSSLNFISALDPDSRDVVDPNAQFGDENFLIVGVDSRAGVNSAMGAGDTEDAEGARSDTVMLVNIPANRERVVAVSFPRDLAITPQRCEAWNAETGEYGPILDDDTGTYGPRWLYTETKLNSAYSFGGPKCLVKVIQKLSGLSINRFMAVDFAGFSNMVDALGGVEVCSTTPLVDYELGTVLDQAGRQRVDGHTALNYVRARQVTTEHNGDYGRIKRQQLFLSSLLRSLISSDTFFSLTKLNNVVNMFIDDSYVDNIKTMDLVDLGQSLQGVHAGRITFVTVPTTGETDEDGNEPPRKADIRALFDAIIDDDPLPGENEQDATSQPSTATSSSAAPLTAGETATATEDDEEVEAVTTTPEGVTVHVSNSTAESGLAATAADELEQHGFNVLEPDDYPSALSSTTVFFSPGNEPAAATVASSFANPQIKQVTGMGNVVQVVLGPDFYFVSAPEPSGSSVSVHIDHGSSSTPTALPEDLTVTNAADTTCD